MSKSRPKRIFLIAGEQSGDAHGAQLVRALHAQDPTIEFEGLGGPLMKAAGVKMDMDFTKHAVMGFWRVVPKVPFFRRLGFATLDKLIEDPPDLIVPIDYPGFNLRFSIKAKRHGFRICYYVSPQVWGWGASRLKKIARIVDHMMVLFQFEVPIYEKVGVPVDFVGHPLFAELDKWSPDESYIESLELPKDHWVVGLMPGSRDHEIYRNLPIQLRAAQLIREQTDHPIHFVLPFPKPELKSAVRKVLKKGPKIGVQAIEGHFNDIAHVSRLALVCSGTATFQLLYHQVPMVIQYRISPWAMIAAKLFMKTKFFGLANIVTGKDDAIVPEFALWWDNYKQIAKSALPLLVDGPEREKCLKDMAEGKAGVHFPDAPERAARVVHSVLNFQKALEVTES